MHNKLSSTVGDLMSVLYVNRGQKGMDIGEETSSRSIDGIEDTINEDGNGLQESTQIDYLPKIGMVFDSEDDAHQFYNEYARRTGFGTRIHLMHKHRRTGIVIDRVFCCSKEGFRRTDKRDVTVVKQRAETRTGCMARIKIVLEGSGKYIITVFEEMHNHELLLPSMVHMLRSHRKVTEAQAAEIDVAESTGIQAKRTIEMMRREAGGVECLGFMREDCHNYLRSKRMMGMQKGDAGALLEYFQKKQSEDASFFYAIQLDNEDLISNIFWADSGMMADYSYFGDVVCFDTTYKTNKYGRPFGLFVGVNHHRQTKIFGAALLYDESTQTFSWLFESFVRAMSGKRSKTILTDHDQAMTSAIAAVLPDTYHRFCVWHMFQNAAKHLSDVFSREKSFARDFSRCVYEYEDADEFIEAWNTMINKYDLSSNKWLKAKFDEKEKWSLAYGRNTFSANMSTTQRSESMNASLKAHLHSQKDLLGFLGRFDEFLDDRRYEELKADCKMMNSTPVLPIEGNQMLESARDVYTEEIYELVRREVLDGVLNCDMQVHREVGEVVDYTVSNASIRRRCEHTVTFDRSTTSVNCSCKKYEFSGILCCHAFYILRINAIRKIPNEYILKRWTKEAKSGLARYKQGSDVGDDPKAAVGRRFRELCRMFVQTARKAALHEEISDFASDLVKEIESGVNRMIKEKNKSMSGDNASQKVGSEREVRRVNASEQSFNLDCANRDSVGDNDYQSTSVDDTEILSRAKGIKQKVRGGPVEKSVRRQKSALEQSIKRTRKKGKQAANIACNALGQEHGKQQMDAATFMPLGSNSQPTQSAFTPLTPYMRDAFMMPISPLTPHTEAFQAILSSNQVSHSTVGDHMMLAQGLQGLQGNYAFTQLLQPFVFSHGKPPNAK